jgi:hypothetical protein
MRLHNLYCDADGQSHEALEEELGINTARHREPHDQAALHAEGCQRVREPLHGFGRGLRGEGPTLRVQAEGGSR